MKGIFGRPGTAAMTISAAPATIGARLFERTCLAVSVPRSSSDAARVTMMPVAIEIISAGICAARPSPTVSSEKCAGGLAERHALLERRR